RLGAALLGVFAGLSLVNASTGDARRFAGFSFALSNARQCVIDYRTAPDPCVGMFYMPDTWKEYDHVRQLPTKIESLRIGPFRSAAKLPSSQDLPLLKSLNGGHIDSVSVDPLGESIRIVGWARDPDRLEPAKTVYVSVDGEIVGQATMGIPRPD